MQEMYEDDAISVSESANGRTIANRQTMGDKYNIENYPKPY